MQAVLNIFNVSKLSRLLPWLGALILIVGVVVYLDRRGDHITAQRNAADLSAAASYKPDPKPNLVRLKGDAREIAGKFVIDAVQRKNLAEAWKIAAPEMKEGISYKQWMTGNIPVVPFTAPLKNAPLKVDYALKDKALLEVALIPKDKKHQTAGGVFWLTMKTIGKGEDRKWVVVSWVPRWRAPLPSNPAN